jgi:redox-sensitive bicupin YhaK (pirin superfamily)
MSIGPVNRLIKAKPTLEGAGVHLRRAFGFGNTTDFDPFLLLDDFRNDIPEDYLAGFPWHPHRGIETITYVLAGEVEHGDSMGNRGAIAAGDVQWMTAGRGIIHQEMPKGDPQGRMHGFQLWANLPAALKMTAPRYQEIKAGEIPQITDDDGTHVRLICGHFWGKRGPVEGIAADPTYIDVSVPAGKRKTFCRSRPRAMPSPMSLPERQILQRLRTAGRSHRRCGLGRHKPPAEADDRSLVVFDQRRQVEVEAGPNGIRFLLVSGKPLEGARRLVRPDRHEHAAATPAGVPGTGEGYVLEEVGQPRSGERIQPTAQAVGSAWEESRPRRSGTFSPTSP